MMQDISTVWSEIKLHDFLAGLIPDKKGRCYDQILRRSNRYLEYCHDYIQELFPTDSPSRFVSHAPVITAAQAAAWSSNDLIRLNMHNATERMIRFYTTKNWRGKYQWLTPHNHNYKRISRILHSLRMFGLDAEADLFYRCIMNIVSTNPGVVDDTTKAFWATNNQKTARDPAVNMSI
ncbi:opioid growth factor receptor-related protein [Butyrivibrio sp.]|uniref:opioid growth factor receptor-related protein n=1 Tax=Butyrivibrio sp. TaxID=28121 RepID=UPI0025B824CC|nr:opioid growth factor receptor-related protein [Butyrivibrio sp.]MBQ7428342.1 hypothetical protein [Butyrivibrio sp.]MBQ9303646.1 hypothetical protein [Butyrivibrio sp.]